MNPSADVPSPMDTHRCGTVQIDLPSDCPLVEQAEETCALLNIPEAAVLQRTWRWRGPTSQFYLEAWTGGVPRPGESVMILAEWGVGAGELAVRIARCRSDSPDGPTHHMWFQQADCTYHLTLTGVEDSHATRIAQSIR